MDLQEFSEALEGIDPATVALGAGVIGMMLVIMGIFAVAIYFISAIGYYQMFKKVGEAGWKAFIPYYNNYICFKFAWNTKYFWFFLAVLILVQVLPLSGSLLVSLLNLAAVIVFAVLGIKLDIRVAGSFGKTAGWGVLLFFFPFIVSMILGFGKAEYLGNVSAETKNA